MTAIRPLPEPSEVRAALVEICIKVSIVAVAFAAIALALRLSGSTLVFSMAGCGIVALLLEASRRRALAGLPEGARIALALFVCASLGVGVALLRSHGGLLFLPCLFVLGTVSVLSTPRFLVLCSALVAAGFLFPVIGSEKLVWSSPFAAAALVLLPLALQSVFRGLGGKAQESPIREPMQVASAQRLTPRQAEVSAMLAQGMRHGEIAEELGVSTAQVRRLIRQARERTGARTSAELVARSLVDRPHSQAEKPVDTPN